MIALTTREMEVVRRVKKAYMATKEIKKLYSFGKAIRDMWFDGCTEWDDLKIADEDFKVIDKIIDRFLDTESDIDFIEDYLDTL